MREGMPITGEHDYFIVIVSPGLNNWVAIFSYII